MKSGMKCEEFSVSSKVATTFSVHWILLFSIESTKIKESVHFDISGLPSIHYLRKRNEAKW